MIDRQDRTMNGSRTDSLGYFRGWTFAQWALFVLAMAHLAQAVAGYIAEASFATGPGAPTAQVLGMDYNGWHAVAGLALFAPALVAVLRPSWTVLYLLVAAVAGGAPGVWALFSHQVAWVFTFPNNQLDAAVHLATSVVLLLVVAVQARLDGGLRVSLADLGVPRRDGRRLTS